MSVLDISYATKLSPQTIYKFLHGKPVYRSTLNILQRMVDDFEAQKQAQKPTG